MSNEVRSMFDSLFQAEDAPGAAPVPGSLWEGVTSAPVPQPEDALKQAYIGGQQAFEVHVPRAMNPFDAHTDEHASWDEGYAAKHEALMKSARAKQARR